LLDLAEIVGPGGEVVGVDSSAEAVATARETVANRGLANVSIVHADINALDSAAIAGDRPFDAAHMRSVLIHQSDPMRTLERVARLVGPGGKILMRELVDDKRYPCFDPPLPTIERAFELVSAAVRSRGASVDVGRHLVELCSNVGLSIVDARGTFSVTAAAEEPILGFHGMLASSRRTLTEAVIAEDDEIDELLNLLTAARSQQFRSVIGPLFVHVIAQVQ
jgi:SAM-dependent methyltransferase